MKRIHFVGIGGIGVSALAKYYLARGWQVSGSDLAVSEITKDLKKRGVVVRIGHRPENLPAKIDRLVYSAAAAPDNSELKKARELGFAVLSYAEAVGELTKTHFTLAVSGSHGKSTTTAMLALMMIKAGLDPTVIVGTRLREFKGSNFRMGRSKYLVIEADEYNRSFLNYYPKILVLTNIDKEHLDTYGDLKGVIKGFSRYFQNVGPDGIIIANRGDQPTLAALRLKRPPAKAILYGTGRWPLKIFGEYNQLNAEAAWQAARRVGVSAAQAESVLKNYRGAWRRCESLSPRTGAAKWRGFSFFSDYAHHPTEIKATLDGLNKKFPNRPLAVVFQPHQIKRLTDLFSDFIGAFKQADALAIMPAYRVVGRDLSKGKTAKDLFLAIEKSGRPGNLFYLRDFKESFKVISKFPKAVAVFMGAGDIDKEARKYFKSKLMPM